MRFRLRPVAAVAALAATAAVLTGCGSGASARPVAVGTLRPGFLTPGTTPPPEATISPRPGSWDGVRPGEGYRVVLLTAGRDAQTRTLAAAVTSWAKAEKVHLETIAADTSAQYIPVIGEAVRRAPDLIVSAGNNLVDPLALVTANHLDQKFLVVGAELAEPTANVTAVDWTGASFRGEGLGMSSTYDAASFTPERSARAVRAGVAAVLSNLTGIVIWIA